MASTVYLVSMGLMGLLALIVVATTVMSRDWADYTPRIGREKVGFLAGLARSETGWTLGFFLLVLLGTAATFSALSGGGTTLFLGLVALVVLGVLTIGVYAAGRSRGHPHAYAVGEVVITLGFLVLVAVTGYLLANFGA